MKKWLADRRIQNVVIVLCCVLLNANTLFHEYAHDDEIIIVKNMQVQAGVAGIGRILSSDAFQSYMEQMNVTSSPIGGGRYRPLSMVSFAIEQEIFGKTLGDRYNEIREQLANQRAVGGNAAGEKELLKQLHAEEDAIRANNLRVAPFRHGFQIVFFALAMLALFRFLADYLLPERKTVAFIAVLLFIFHPIHTEVIANLKSRDEIFSLLFLSLSFTHFFHYVEESRKKDLYLGLLTLVCALLSKEYALIFFILLPIGVMLRYGKGFEVLKSRWFIATLITTGLFVVLRASIVASPDVDADPELLNDPFLYASAEENIATRIYLLNQYLRLLFFPHPLSADYSFNHFTYKSFSDAAVWLSLFTWLVIAGTAVWLWLKKHRLAFAFALFLGFFMLVNNLLFDIGATMGERLIFHSSVGFCIVVSWLLVQASSSLTTSLQLRHAALAAVLLILCAPMGYKTITRNKDWKNNFTLFTRDVKYVPNSAVANGNAGTEYFNKGFLPLDNKIVFTEADRRYLQPYADSGVKYFTRALQIYPGYLTALMNRGLCYVYTNNIDSAAQDWIRAAKIYKTRNPTLVNYAMMLYDRGMERGTVKDFPGAVKYFSLAAQVDTVNAVIWENLGGALFMSGELPRAADAFSKALSLDPNLQGARNGYNTVMQNLGNSKEL